jgi:hypothetical protein
MVMHDDALTTLLADRAQLAVARRVPLPILAAVAALPGYQWHRDEHGYCNRPDLATVRARTQIGRFEVDIELTPWTETTSEVVVRPAARSPHRWGARRRQQWYAGAHAAVDELRSELLVAASRLHPSQTGGRHAAATEGVLSSRAV